MTTDSYGTRNHEFNTEKNKIAQRNPFNWKRKHQKKPATPTGLRLALPERHERVCVTWGTLLSPHIIPGPAVHTGEVGRSHDASDGCGIPRRLWDPEGHYSLGRGSSGTRSVQCEGIEVW